MSDANTPPSVAGADAIRPESTGDTVPAGAMHLSGAQAEPSGAGGMFFLGGGSVTSGALQVEFVDLTAAAVQPARGGPISFDVWLPVAGATVPGASGLGSALDGTSAGMLADFSTGTSAMVSGGIMQPEPARPAGSVALADAPQPPIGVPLPIT